MQINQPFRLVYLCWLDGLWLVYGWFICVGWMVNGWIKLEALCTLGGLRVDVGWTKSRRRVGGVLALP